MYEPEQLFLMIQERIIVQFSPFRVARRLSTLLDLSQILKAEGSLNISWPAAPLASPFDFLTAESLTTNGIVAPVSSVGKRSVVTWEDSLVHSQYLSFIY